jgi:hypothetical protein
LVRALVLPSARPSSSGSSSSSPSSPSNARTGRRAAQRRGRCPRSSDHHRPGQSLTLLPLSLLGNFGVRSSRGVSAGEFVGSLQEWPAAVGLSLGSAFRRRGIYLVILFLPSGVKNNV